MKKVFCVLMCIFVMLMAVGCTMEAPSVEKEPEKAESEPAATESEKIVIGYSPQSMEFAYFQDVVKGMEKAIEDSGLDIELVIKDPQMDAVKQVNGAEELAASGATTIIVCAADMASMPSFVEYVQSKDLNLVSHISPFEGADAYVSLDDYSFGKIGGDAAGKYITEHMGGEANVAVLHSKAVGENLVQRYQGYVDGILEYAPNAKIVAEAAGEEEAKAMEALEGMLTEFPEINFVVSTNDPGQLGAYAACESMGRTDDVLICGIGSEQRVLEYIRDGKLLHSVGDAAYETGIILMESAIKLEKGEEVEKDHVMECKLIDADVAVEMLERAAS